MTTRSTIWKQQKDGSFVGVYVHNDGYLNGVGKTLYTHYSVDEDKIDALIALGAMSVVDRNPYAPPAGHTFNKPVAGYCIAYMRDRGEEFLQKTAATIQDMDFEDYNYIWMDGRWHYVEYSLSENGIKILDNLYTP